MPIHDLGYRAWQGERLPGALRFWPITATGVRLAWQSRPLRRLMFFAWLPALYMAFAFFFFEQGWNHAVYNLIPGSPAMKTPFSLQSGVPEAIRRTQRHEFWSGLLWVFFRYPQALLMVIVVGLVAPPLVAQDVRTRAFLLYFSRPLARAEYVLGKVLVVWFYLAMITTVPALLLYVLAVMLSPDLSVLAYTWDLPLRVLGASLVLGIPTTLLALAFSSLSSETRYATFAWFTVWALGFATYLMMVANLGPNLNPRWVLVSLYHALAPLQGWVFGVEKRFADVLPSAIELAVVAVLAWVVLFRRVSAPMRV